MDLADPDGVAVFESVVRTVTGVSSYAKASDAAKALTDKTADRSGKRKSQSHRTEPFSLHLLKHRAEQPQPGRRQPKHRWLRTRDDHGGIIPTGAKEPVAAHRSFLFSLTESRIHRVAKRQPKHRFTETPTIVMSLKAILKKIRDATWGKVLRKIRCSSHYPKCFVSYWHARFHRKTSGGGRERLYLGARPNPGAGIGHQMANWIAGYWWAKQFGLKFAHSPFPSPAWERFLGFGEHEATVRQLSSGQGYEVVEIPPFTESSKQERELIENIISSYQGRKVVFLFGRDQPYRDQIGVIDDLQKKFHQAPARQDDKLVFTKDRFNIAVHVRRGDIVAGQKTGNANHQMRWQDNEYFRKVLGNVLAALVTDKPIAIYLFSQGLPEDFSDFGDFENIRLCLDMGAQDSFLHMVFADLLITSKSSFSYKPALLSKGIRVCPRDFWHVYPDDREWIMAESDGTIGVNTIQAGGLLAPAEPR